MSQAIGLLPFLDVHVRLNRPHGQPQSHIQRPHPFHVAAGQVVVDRHDVDALALQRIEIRRQRGDQRLAFAGDHFGDRAAVQHHAADQLHVVVPHADERRPASRQTAKASTRRSSSVSPAANRSRNLAVCCFSSSLLIASYVGSRRLMASTFVCSLRMYRALDEPNSDGDATLEARHQPAKKQAD